MNQWGHPLASPSQQAEQNPAGFPACKKAAVVIVGSARRAGSTINAVAGKRSAAAPSCQLQ